MTQTTNQLNDTNTPKTVINVTPTAQDKIIDQVIVQSGGVGLGIFISLIAFVLTIRYLGAGTLISKFMDNLEKGADSLKSLTTSIDEVTKELDINHQKYVADHKDIIDKIAEVKELLNVKVFDTLRDIERKLNK